MYKCGKCQTVVPPKIKAHRVAVETRIKHYPLRKKVQKKINNEGKVIYVDDPGGIGYETVREIVVCPECAEKLQQE